MPSRIEINSSEPDPAAFGLMQRDLDDGTCAVAVEGELDLATAPSLKKMLNDPLQAGRNIVIDLSRATFMDSTALGVLLDATRRLGDNARLAIACTRPNIMRIFEFSGLDGAFAIFPALDEAHAYVRGREACTS